MPISCEKVVLAWYVNKKYNHTRNANFVSWYSDGDDSDVGANSHAPDSYEVGSGIYEIDQFLLALLKKYKALVDWGANGGVCEVNMRWVQIDYLK